MTNITFLLISLFCAKFIMAQEQEQTFVTYKDTTKGFLINIPSHWKYGVNKAMPKLALVAMHIPSTQGETVRNNFNINVVSTSGKNLDQTFATFRNALKAADDFRIVAIGDTTINGAEFKWIIETHTNQVSRKAMLNYDFVTMKGDKTYILTLVTSAEAFPEVKSLFENIAQSFRIDH